MATLFALVVFVPLFFWCCCELPTGGVTFRRYGTSSPPDFEQKWDAGTNCTPFAVDSSGNVYTFSSPGPGNPNGSTQPNALTKWDANGALAWSLPVGGTPGGVCLSPDGAKVVFTGNFQQANVTLPPITPIQVAFQTGSSGTVTIGDAQDTIVETTDYIALQFASPLPPFAGIFTNPTENLSVYCPVADESTASVSLYFETVANSAPLAATANNISSRTTSGAGNNPLVWSSAGESLGDGWHSPPTGWLGWLSAMTHLPGYEQDNAFTLILQGHQVVGQSLGDLDISLTADPTLAPQLMLTYQPAPDIAICCDTDTGAVVWSSSAQAAEVGLLGRSVFDPAGDSVFATVPLVGFSSVTGICKLDASTGVVEWFTPVPVDQFNIIGDLTFSPAGVLYATTIGQSNQIGELWSVDPVAGGWTGIGGEGNWPYSRLTAFEDGSIGATNLPGGYIVSFPPATPFGSFTRKWSFGGPVAGAVTDGTVAWLVTGGALTRVNAEGTVDYTYTIPLVPPLVAGSGLAPASFVAIDPSKNVYVGGTYVAFEPPG